MRFRITEMSKKRYILYIVGIFAISSLFSLNSASALTYSQDVGVSFTFNSALRLTVSSDLFINNLAPGTTADSNEIIVNVLSNNITGYSLNATVGNTTYNTRNLVHNVSGSSANFASIAFGSSLANLTTDSTWGYSYSVNNNFNWTNYSGLPLYSDTSHVATLKTTTGPSANSTDDNIYFKIAAKAASNQASGLYRNVINFTTVANAVPQYTVQFNANTGTGTMPNQVIFRDEATMLSANLFAPPAGKVFAGWNTAANGSGTSYTDQQQVTNLAADGGTIILYAQWDSTICNGHETELYCKVAAMSKGTQTASDLQAVITVPTSSNPAADTSNSGVYEYNSSAFGTASDANNAYPIYYYRGILDSNLDGTTSTYGSNGDGAYYPNYVKLGNTCWRIIRTTGSGGVKMIYNGLYSSGTTANSCANATSHAQITSKAFNGDSSTTKQIVRLGYTYNDTYATNTAYTVPISTALGSNSNYAVNNTDSTMKDYLENTWFASSNGISAYESILEPSAGYCNDRTVFNNTSPYTQQAESTNIVTYGTSDLDFYRFGADTRNGVSNATRTITLSCPRNIVDLYTTSSASNGNKQLRKPIALLTADEASLSGSGSGSQGGSNYNNNSFLRSGSDFFLLSPRSYQTDGTSFVYSLRTSGTISGAGIGNSEWARPVISLNPGVIPASGAGTATDPWVIPAP